MNITFTPVSCHRGRKWRGDRAYYIGCDPYYGSFGTISTKLWDPQTKHYVYANSDFVENYDVDPEPSKTEADKQDYLKSIYDGQKAYCLSKKPNLTTSELASWMRNSLLRFHSELKEWIDMVLPDNRDVVKEVEHTLQWAMTLKTRPCMIYGKMCKGGNPLPQTKKIQIALSSLKKRGITQLAGFEMAWKFMLDQMNLHE